jgi:predicted TIM-barrel fold metal-dependent hydrolase
VIERYDGIGIEKGVLLPLIGPEVYLPQSNEDILDMCENSGGRLIPFCNIDPRGMTNSPDAPFGKWLRHYRDRGCRGIGEVMPNLPFGDPRCQNLFRHVEDVGFPLIFDISDRIGGDYGFYDDPGLPQLERTLRSYPGLRVLGHGPAFWAEIGPLRTPADRSGYPSYVFEQEGVVPNLLRQYPNLYGDLSAGSGFNALVRNPKYAVQFLNEFQDRLMFGTDICSAHASLPLAGFLLNLLGQGKLSQEAFSKIAKDNAVQILEL